MSDELEFRSADGRFGVVLPGHLVQVLLRLTRRAGRKETGGVLVGCYTEALDIALVEKVSAAPKDSRAGWASFERGVRGLGRWLARLWASPQRLYYLGEWHFHPYASAEASSTDRAQMVAFARDEDLRCPEPILLILGGDPRGAWEVRAYVFLRDARCIRLARVRVQEGSICSAGDAGDQER